MKLWMARWFLLVGAVLVICAAPSAAGDSIVLDHASHVDIGAPKVDVAELQRRFFQAEEQLKKLGQNSLRSKIESLLKKGFDTPRQGIDLQDIKRRIQSDEALRQALEQWMRDYQKGSNRLPLSPEAEKEIRKLLENLGSGGPGTMLPQITPPSITPPSITPPTTPTPVMDQADLESRARFARWLSDQAKRLENVEAIKNSPALKQASIDLSNYAKTKSLQNLERFNFDKQLSKLGVKSLPEKLLTNLQESLPRNITLPRLPRANLPRVNLGWKPSPPGSLPNLGTPSLPTGGDASMLLWLVVAALLVFLAFRLFRSYRAGLAEQIGQRLWARRWPVSPDAVWTREDLIQAFEHLSLSRLGLESRSWNHREIAEGLSAQTVEHRPDADLLADLYEQARYAPASEPLSDADLATARRVLHHLVGALSA